MTRLLCVSYVTAISALLLYVADPFLHQRRGCDTRTLPSIATVLLEELEVVFPVRLVREGPVKVALHLLWSVVGTFTPTTT